VCVERKLKTARTIQPIHSVTPVGWKLIKTGAVHFSISITHRREHWQEKAFTYINSLRQRAESANETSA
jgi:hypothetical protein